MTTPVPPSCSQMEWRLTSLVNRRVVGPILEKERERGQSSEPRTCVNQGLAIGRYPYEHIFSLSFSQNYKAKDVRLSYLKQSVWTKKNTVLLQWGVNEFTVQWNKKPRNIFIRGLAHTWPKGVLFSFKISFPRAMPANLTKYSKTSSWSKTQARCTTDRPVNISFPLLSLESFSELSVGIFNYETEVNFGISTNNYQNDYVKFSPKPVDSVMAIVRLSILNLKPRTLANPFSCPISLV